MNDEIDPKTNNQPVNTDAGSTAVDKPAVSPAGVPTEPPSGGATAPKGSVIGKPPKKPKKTLLLVLVLLLLAGAGAAAYMFLTKDDTQQVATVETKEVELIRIGSVDGPANSIFPGEMFGVATSQNRQIYEGLVGNEDGTFVPLLATSWTNPDEKTWVFQLKPGVKFHTGKTMTADDVKRSLEAIKAIDHLAFLSPTIDTVEALSETEVKITTTEPDSLLLNRLSISYITDQDAADKIGNNGTGAYTLDITTYDETNATLVANDNYHGGRPKTRKLTYKVYAADAELNTAIKANEVDVIETIPESDATDGLSDVGLATTSYEAPGTFGLYMNMLREDTVLANKEVRKAIAQAVDREALVKELDGGYQVSTQAVPKSLPGHDADITFPASDAAAAKATLAAAGYPNGVTLDYVFVNEVQPDPPIIIKQLEAAGFKINAIGSDEIDPTLDAVFAGEFDLFSAAYTSDLADSRDLMGSLLESTEQSYPVYSDPDFDKLLEDSDKEFDPTKRIAILQEANKYIADNYLWIPLRNTAYVAYYKPALDITLDYSAGGSMGVYYWRVGEKVSN